jgi:MFS family permease
MAPRLRRLRASVGWWDALATPGPTRVLALNALVDAGGTGLAAVCLPFYAIRVAGLGTGELALVLTVAGLCELLAAVPNGAVAGRLGVKPFTIAAKLVQAAAYGGLAFSGGLPAVLAASVVAGIARAGGSGLNQSLTVAVLGEQERAGTLGAVRALRNIGYLVAGGLGGLILATDSATGLRLALLANGVSFLAGAWWVATLRPQRRAEVPERTDWSVLRDWEYLGLICCAAVFGSSLVVLDVGIPLWTLQHDNVPTWTTAAFVIMNTLLVVLLQVRFAKRVDKVPAARRGIKVSALAFCVMAVLLALTPWAPTPVAVALVGAAAVALTFGELLESPSWWTVSYELAPAGRKDEYLAAFDLSWAFIGIAGPGAMAGIVTLGSSGWLLYGLALVLAAACGTALVRRRSTRAAYTGKVPSPTLIDVTRT